MTNTFGRPVGRWPAVSARNGRSSGPPASACSGVSADAATAPATPAMPPMTCRLVWPSDGAMSPP